MTLRSIAASSALALAAALLASTTACTVLPFEQEKRDPPPPPPPPGGDGGDGGGGGGGGPTCDPSCCGAGCCEAVCRDAQQLWFVRIDAGAANLASSYEQVITAAAGAFQEACFETWSILVADLYRPERGVLFQGSPYRDSYSGRWVVAGVANAIRNAAASAGPVPARCPTVSVAALGAMLPPTWYGAPAALFVGVLDPSARPVGYGDASCPDAATRFAAADPVEWVPFDGLARRRTRFWAIASSETLSGADQRAACLAAPGFPRTAVDVVAPSPLAFYGPWTSDLQAWGGSELATHTELCGSIGGGFAAAVPSWVRGWGDELGVYPE